jgi:hypothetical protein
MELLQQRHGTTVFYLVSEAIPPSYYQRLSKEIIGRRLDVRLSSYCRVEKNLSAAFFKLLYKAGVRSLTFGAEAAENRILKLIDKGNTVEDIQNTIRVAHGSGIHVKFNFIPDYPTITWPEVQRSIAFVRDNFDYIDELNAQFFDLSSNSIILKEQEQHGLEAVHGNPIQTNHGVHSIAFVRTAGLTESDSRRTRDAFGRLASDVREHRRIRDLVNLVQMPQFDWKKAAFVLATDLVSAELPFDLSQRVDGHDAFPRLGRDVFVLYAPETGRRITCGPEAKDIVEVSDRLAVFTIDDVVRHVVARRDVSDIGQVAADVQHSLEVMLRNGMIADITHPWFELENASGNGSDVRSVGLTSLREAARLISSVRVAQ